MVQYHLRLLTLVTKIHKGKKKKKRRREMQDKESAMSNPTPEPSRQHRISSMLLHPEITTPGPLHSQNGTLANPGFMRTPLLGYDRSLIRASSWRLKEWDYYLISDSSCALCLTIADLGYAALYSVSLIDLGSSTRILDPETDNLGNIKPDTVPEGSKANSKTVSVIKPLTFGSTGLPTTSMEGITSVEHSKIRLRFVVTRNSDDDDEDDDDDEENQGRRKQGATTKRHLSVYVRDFFSRGKPLEAEITLDEEPRDSMVIASPFANHPHSFFYNRKIVGMRATGTLSLGGKGEGRKHVFDPEGGGALGLLDWGRGVWTRDNTWYWAAAHGYHHLEPQHSQNSEGEQSEKKEGKIVRIGFNLGYGFSDPSAATENVFFVDGVGHKLDKIDFGIPDDDVPGKKPSFLKQWNFTSNDGRLEMTLTPIVDRADYINLGLVVSDQHQIMGRCAGKVILDDGSVLKFEDLLATAEKIRNKW
ncbi:hypothetical protein GGS20DRAFT_92298 [Poronia punctata]|nr:hypothetical protein GGS20DRAFT_92298 [Poronia punctata]